jgi:hypothetical protein
MLVSEARVTIRLGFINETAVPMPTVVVFQKNAADPFGDTAIAWQIVPHTSPGSESVIDFDEELSAGANDAHGGYLPPHDIAPGQALSVTAAPSGELFAAPVPATAAGIVQVRNGLPNRPIEAAIYRSGRLLARKTRLQPGDTAAFRFDREIRIGVAPVVEGQVMNAAMLAGLDTCFALDGFEAATIVMRGGGDAPYRFEMRV